MLISTVLFALSLWGVGLGAEIPFSGLLVIASVLGSTDPIAVGALLKELGAPHKLNMLLEGEALLNDGTSLICYQVFTQVYRGHTPGFWEVLRDLCTLCIGGPALGFVVGFLFYTWMRRIIKDGVLIVSMTFISCFLVFFLCEYFPWNLSGILAIVAAALVQASKGKLEIMADELWGAVETVWKFAQFVGESLLFVLTGIFIGNEFTKLQETEFELFWMVFQITLFFVLMNLSRFAMIFVFIPLLNSSADKHEYKIGVKQAAVMAYSGIRGAFPLIICLMIAKTPEYPAHFRQVAVMVTIMTISLGVIFNGMTVKSIINFLEVIPINPIKEKWQSITQKDIYNKLIAEMEILKRKPDLSVASWPIVQDLCGLKTSAQVIGRQESRLQSTQMRFSSSNKMLIIETRMRVLAFFKNFVLERLKGAEFSTQSAHMLIEIADFSEETSYNTLGLWTYLEEYVRGSYTISILNSLTKIPSIEPYVRNWYYQELSIVYETIFNFSTGVNTMILDKTFLENIPNEHVNLILRELEEMKQKASAFMVELAAENQVVIQLYQTKRACKELIYKRRKFVKELWACGILEDSEFAKKMNENKKMLVKVDNFGFSVNEVFIKEVFDSCIVFADLDEEAKGQMFAGYRKQVYNPGEFLFRFGDKTQGMFIVLDGSVEERFRGGSKKLRLFGSILGIRFFLSEDLTYFSEAKCLTKCTMALFPIELLQKVVATAPAMEKSIYYMCMLNILVEKEQQLLTANKMMNMVEEFQVHKLKRSETIELDHGFVLLRGMATKRVTSDPSNPDFVASGDEKRLLLFDLELNLDRLRYTVKAENDVLIADFVIKNFREIDSIRSASMRQSSNFFHEQDNIQRTYQRMTNFMKLNY